MKQDTMPAAYDFCVQQEHLTCGMCGTKSPKSYFSDENIVAIVLGYITNLELLPAGEASLWAYIAQQIQSGKTDELVARMSGLYTILLYSHDTLWIISDRYRSRPVFYYETKEGLFFSSEIPALFAISSADVKFDWRHAFRVNNYSLESNLCWEKINEIGPGQILTCGQRGVIMKCWKDSAPKESGRDLDAILKDVICKPDFSDAMLSLSGGVDSGLLAYYMRGKIRKAVTLKNDTTIEDGEYKRAQWMSAINHYRLLDAIPKLMDPHQYLSLLLHYASHTMPVEYIYKYFIFKTIKEEGSCLAVTGQGVDEMFGGYSCEYESYPAYQKHFYKTAVDSKLFRLGVHPEKALLIRTEGIHTLLQQKNLNHLREFDIRTHISALGWNGLYTEGKCASYFQMMNASPFLENELFCYALATNQPEQLYDKKIFRDLYANKYHTKSPQKKAFVYGNHYKHIQRFLIKQLYYNGKATNNMMDAVVNTMAFSDYGILDRDAFFKLLELVENGMGSQETVEIVFKLANCALLDTYMSAHVEEIKNDWSL